MNIQEVAAAIVIWECVRRQAWWKRWERKAIAALKKEWQDKWTQATWSERAAAAFVLAVIVPPMLAGLFAAESAMVAQVYHSPAMQAWTMAAGALILLVLMVAGAQGAWRGGRKLIRRRNG